MKIRCTATQTGYPREAVDISISREKDQVILTVPINKGHVTASFSLITGMRIKDFFQDIFDRARRANGHPVGLTKRIITGYAKLTCCDPGLVCLLTGVNKNGSYFVSVAIKSDDHYYMKPSLAESHVSAKTVAQAKRKLLHWIELQLLRQYGDEVLRKYDRAQGDDV